MELFCGPGGLAVGAKESSIQSNGEKYEIEPVWANDLDLETCETYSLNIHGAPLAMNVGCVNPGNVSDYVSTFKDIHFNALAFGFPCNDFSNVGETKGFEGSFGPLYTYGVRAINAGKPEWFLAENVGGLRGANEGSAFKKIIHDLENSGENGYHLTAHLFKFEQYGVPQARHRIIIVGYRNDLNLKFSVPAPTHETPSKYVTAKLAITTPPIKDSTANHVLTKQSQRVIDRLMCIPPGENAWYLDKLVNMSDQELKAEVSQIPTFKQAFPNSKTAREIRDVIEKVKLNVNSARMSHIYKRLDPNRPSYTVTGSGGGGTHVYHWEEPRALTNRERARIQTFPDNFEFIGSKESVRKQIGMAVPPIGAKAIFSAVLKTCAGKSYKSVEPNLYQTDTKPLELRVAREAD